MLFPDSAKNAISKTFYDKQVFILSDETMIDSEGGIVRRTDFESESGDESTTSDEFFYGNVRFNALGELKDELGLVKNIDIAITCPTDTPVEVNDLLQYNGIKYVATDVLPYDSHKFVLGEKWQAQ